MPIRVELILSHSSSSLVGNDLGESIYDTQVKNIVDFKGINVIVIPNFIKDISISFVQGFTKKIIKQIGANNLHDHFIVEGSEKVVSKFNRAIFF